MEWVFNPQYLYRKKKMPLSIVFEPESVFCLLYCYKNATVYASLQRKDLGKC